MPTATGVVAAQTPATPPEPEQEQEPERPADPRAPRGNEPALTGAIFGEAPVRPGSRHFLDVLISAAGVRDDNVMADRFPPGQAPPVTSTSYPSGQAALTYRGLVKRATVDVAAASGMRYYPDLPQRYDRNQSVAAGIAVPWSRHTTFRAEQSLSYATYYTLAGIPSATIPATGPEPQVPGTDVLQPNAAFGVSSAASSARQTTLSLTRDVGRRGLLDTRYNLGWNDFPAGRSRVQQAGFTYLHNYTRDFGLRTGYQFEAVSGNPASPVFHTLDVGVNIQRSLSRSRRTTFTLQTGSAFVTQPVRDIELTADAQLIHLSGRTWTTSLQYLRGTNYVGALAALMTSNTVQATTNGFISPALELTVSGRYTDGSLGSGPDGNLTTYAAIADVQYGLSRWLALDAGYFYYFYDSVGTLPTLGPTPNQLQRQGFRAGVSVFLPLVR